MITPEQKLKELKHIINMAANKENDTDIQKRLYDLLLADTNGTGKLYKYRSFDTKGNNLQGLQDGTLYCAAPNEFNDPFDSKIGMSIEKIIEAKIEKEIALFETITDQFVKVENKQIAIDDCSPEHQHAIRLLQQNTTVRDFINQKHEVDPNDEDAVTQYIATHFNFIVELVTTLLQDSLSSTQFHLLNQFLKNISGDINKKAVAKLLSGDYSISGFANTLNTYGNNEVETLGNLANKYCSSHYDVNDAQKKIHEISDRYNQIINKTFLLGCLTNSYDNPLLWAHYASNHTGFCIEYDFTTVSSTHSLDFPSPIIYSKERAQFPWHALENKTPENTKAAMMELTLGLLTKDYHWQYEGEWRILVKATEGHYHVMPKVTCIYLGACISDDNKAKIINIAKSIGASVKQMCMSLDSFALYTEDVLII